LSGSLLKFVQLLFQLLDFALELGILALDLLIPAVSLCGSEKNRWSQGPAVRKKVSVL